MFILHHRARRKAGWGSGGISMPPPQCCLLAVAVLCLARPALAQTSTSSSMSTTASTSISASASTTSLPASVSASASALTSSASHSSVSHSSSRAPASPSATISLSGLPVTYTLPSLNSTLPYFILDLPTVSSLFLTLNICGLGTNASVVPSVLVSAITTSTASSSSSTSSTSPYAIGTRASADAASGGVGAPNRKSRAGATWLLEWDAGFANWTWTGTQSVDASVLVGLNVGTDGTVGGTDADDGNIVVQFSASTDGPLYALEASPPYLGDTTTSSALIFSPLLLASPQPQPAYPNYTLPGAYLSPPSFPTGNATVFGANQNLSLVLVPTGHAAGLENSFCAVVAANTSAGVGAAAGTGEQQQAAGPSWMSVGGQEGFRDYWVVDGLNATSNYTAWVMDVETQTMTGPVWMVTKEDAFPCPLVLPSSICPSVGYAAAVDGTSPVLSLPDNVTSVLSASLDAFSTSLLTQACGRDYYSHVSSCLDCYSAYRDWLCRIVVARCASAGSSSSAAYSSSGEAGTAFPAPSTAARDPVAARNPAVLAASYAYTELLPCLGTCNAVDRACPIALGYRCPLRSGYANESYAFVGQVSDKGDGTDGSPDAADGYGNRWCNG
ncbi:stretch-activated cation channel mid1 [Cryptotrichosporon argae]